MILIGFNIFGKIGLCSTLICWGWMLSINYPMVKSREELLNFGMIFGIDLKELLVPLNIITAISFIFAGIGGLFLMVIRKFHPYIPLAVLIFGMFLSILQNDLPFNFTNALEIIIKIHFWQSKIIIIWGYIYALDIKFDFKKKEKNPPNTKLKDN